MSHTQLVVFSLASEEYAIKVSSINRILQAKKFTVQKMPGGNKHLEGIINLRGSINFIYNLKSKFNMPITELSSESKFIMLNINEAKIGCLVDEVHDIIDITDDQIQNPPIFISNDKYIDGVANVDDRMIILLNPEKIFESELNKK